MKFPFVNTVENRTFQIKDCKISLDILPDVFAPSEHGQLLAEHIAIAPGENVLDVGTGSGFLAVLAAKLGGIVWASDNDVDALSCAKRNAQLNDVTMNFILSDLIENIPDLSFDVVIANLPQEIIPPQLQDDFGPKRNNAICGGENGNNVLLRFLEQMIQKRLMKSTGRIYLKINSLSDYKATIQFVINNYSVHWLDFKEKTTKPFVGDFDSYYEELNRKGLIHIFKKDNEWWEENYILELSPL